MHDMLNVVTGPGDYPSAVLIRGIEGAKTPGVLTRQLKIDRSLNAKTAMRASGLWIEDRGITVAPDQIMRTKRIGIAYAKEWADKPWRFVLKA